jgi:hypothetical protein
MAGRTSWRLFTEIWQSGSQTLSAESGEVTHIRQERFATQNGLFLSSDRRPRSRKFVEKETKLP